MGKRTNSNAAPGRIWDFEGNARCKSPDQSICIDVDTSGSRGGNNTEDGSVRAERIRGDPLTRKFTSRVGGIV